MRLKSLIFRSAIILISAILSQYSASCSHTHGLALFGTTLVIWNFLPIAHSVRNTKSGVDGKTAKNLLIDELLKKTEIGKPTQKELYTTTSGDGDLDPVKCFPKALCGVSSEVEQISRRKKNGLVSEYLILMKAVAKHPEFLEDLVSPSSSKTKNVKGTKKKKGQDSPQSDISPSDDASDSEEDDENDSDEEDEEADDLESEPVVKKKKKEPEEPKNDDDFHKAYLKEKVEMDKLLKETMEKDKKEQEQFWWGGGDRPPPREPWNNRPKPQAPNNRPWSFGFGGSGQRPRPSRPYFRKEEEATMPSDDDGSSASGFGGGIAGISTFFSNLFGFGATSLTNDPWFPSAARDLSGEVDETREILETALEIGKSFEKPSQCNEIFNACQYEYTELLYMIDDLRKNVRALVKESQDQGKQKKTTKGKKRKNAKSGLTTSQQMKYKSGRRRKPGKMSSVSGEVPDERYVIPVTPPKPEGFADTFQFSNVLSWLGIGGSSGKY
ncbi:hypothetical protein Fcan01_07125 [Folsomia candida]|uniref:Uncharacterized protein n=1 Tax=Folsomia candida TaxID=158441 RepID=A0A226EN36_FOLCA|nr:hypothetical protein Fcan01_07125 [Folsomia candida]